MSPEELAATAVLADRWGLHDRAIYSAGKAEQKRAIGLRFPVLYRSAVARAAQENRLDPALVMGVMRRESAYIADVQSGAGAIGLMQLMPRTAKFVADLKGLDNWRGDLTDADTNIGFGSFYLRHVLDKFNNHIAMATAGYNAGPHRVTSWLPEQAMDADRWIDTIPYTETRRYVRAVLAYTAIYEWHLTKKPRRLSQKLHPIEPTGGQTTVSY
jgi:soluble lytic murein transglycosylase